MIEPYKTVFADLSPLLATLQFTVENETQFGTTFVRHDGYRLIIAIEQSGEAFSAELEKCGTGLAGHLSPDCLMEALDPANAAIATQAIRLNGFTKESVLIWWRTFLAFLTDKGEIVFSFPSPSPSWVRYVGVCNRKMEEMSLFSCPRIG